MKIKSLCLTIFVILNAICSISGSGTDDYVFPYTQHGLYGLCKKDRTPVTPAIYQKIRSEYSFLLCQKKGSDSWDIYNGQGKLLTNSTGVIRLSDTAFLTFHFKGYKMTFRDGTRTFYRSDVYHFGPKGDAKRPER